MGVMALLEKTEQLLQSRLKEGVSIPEIIEASNGTVGRDWLYKFYAGEIPNPGVRTIQSLHDCLKALRARKVS